MIISPCKNQEDFGGIPKIAYPEESTGDLGNGCPKAGAFESAGLESGASHRLLRVCREFSKSGANKNSVPGIQINTCRHDA